MVGAHRGAQEPSKESRHDCPVAAMGPYAGHPFERVGSIRSDALGATAEQVQTVMLQFERSTAGGLA